MSNMLIQQVTNLGKNFGLNIDGAELLSTLKNTAFREKATDEQLVALMIVANQYKLNPFTKEIYAFPDKSNGIVPVVGIDGWSRIINENTNFDGIEFLQNEDSCTCVIYRKDRNHPITVTEYLSECKRNTGPWNSHPKRMLRHKSMIQCARIAFGYVGIYDQDEAEIIIEMDKNTKKEPPLEVQYIDSKLREAAEQSSKNGSLKYEEFWKKLSVDERKSLISIHADLKDKAKEIDNIILNVKNILDNANTLEELEEAGPMLSMLPEEQKNSYIKIYKDIKAGFNK